jgi:CheY-like chemotaxis protein
VENEDYTLLVVDDGDENRDMLSRRLGRRGYKVLAAEGGERALEIVDVESVDLVLLDIMMPGMDGIEVLRRLRERWDQSELPVIMQTARSESQDMVDALDLGANDYVTKPLDFAVVLARVQSQLRARKQAAAAARKSAEPTAGDLGPGAVIAGKYRLEELIGEGTFGAVYRGTHLELGVEVAVKVLQKSVTATQESVERFRREGVSAYRVRHPNAVAVSDFGVTEGGVAYLVMELLEGVSLADEVAERGALSPHRANQILQPICSVLAEAHAAGIVHRDIKAENVFLHRTPRGEVVKVLDFGISKLAGDNLARGNLTADGFVLGTPAYMAPERLLDEPYDGRSDVYSVGILLFFMLTGELPFVAESGDPVSLIMKQLRERLPTMRSLNPDVPESLERVVARATHKSSRKRPEAAALARELAAAVARIPRLASRRPAAVAARQVDPSAPTVVSTATRPAAPGLLGRFWRRLRGNATRGDLP